MIEPRESITNDELYQRTNALVERIEKAASKATLVLMIASQAVHHGWLYSGTRAGFDEAERELMERIAGWSRSGRMHNLGRRAERVLEKFRENAEARVAGRRAPHTFKAPRKRRKRKATP
jgi:hypothetical protein